MAEKSKKSLKQQIVEGEVKGAPRALLEELFEDYYRHRKRLYYMNFIRGIFFGLGSVLGGTILVALLLWILSLLNYVPFLSEMTEAVKHTIEQGRR